MLNNLRLVILDYPRFTIERESTKRIISDIIQAKQATFDPVEPSYIPISGLDMIGTHFLIYDMADIYNPRPVMGLRVCYEDRTLKHHLRLPCEDYLLKMPAVFQEKFNAFRATKKFLVDGNALFIHPSYRYQKTHTPLAEIGFFMMISHILKRGCDHWVGAANVRFKSSRWAEMTGTSPQDMVFNHHVVQEPHKLLLIDPLNYNWLLNCFTKYGDLYRNRFEITPSSEVTQEVLLEDNALVELLIERISYLKAA